MLNEKSNDSGRQGNDPPPFSFNPENAERDFLDFADMSLEEAIFSEYGQTVMRAEGSRLKIGIAPIWICHAWKIAGRNCREIKSITPRGRLMIAHGLAILQKQLPHRPPEAQSIDPFDLDQAASGVPVDYIFSIKKLRIHGYRIDLPITAGSAAALDDLTEELALTKTKVAQLALIASMATSKTCAADEFASMFREELNFFWAIRAANE